MFVVLAGLSLVALTVLCLRDDYYMRTNAVNRQKKITDYFTRKISSPKPESPVDVKFELI